MPLPEAVPGKRVVLITNHTGIGRARTPDIDLIAEHPELALAALPAPGHGATPLDAPRVAAIMNAKQQVHVSEPDERSRHVIAFPLRRRARTRAIRYAPSEQRRAA